MDEEAIFDALTKLTASVVNITESQEKKEKKTSSIFISIISNTYIFILYW